ncbi:MAG: hypothetical protein HY901_27315, partial [Deltaproteobacteria bacterium]|nr:hypothetical protein [Deltaproteobacteria bacterium]
MTRRAWLLSMLTVASAGGAGCSVELGPLPECVSAATCTNPATECQTRTCIEGRCGVVNMPDHTLLAAQVSGDCKALVCDGHGAIASVAEGSDLPDDANPCTEESCESSNPVSTPTAAGVACLGSATGRVCDGSGSCVECLAPTDCSTGRCIENRCVVLTCGNGAIDQGEACDGTDLAGQSCTTQGFASGVLTCKPGCTFDTTACVAVPTCGNGAIDQGEACDGTDLAGQSCLTQGFASGALTCSPTCTFDSTGCVAAPSCGNGAVDQGEDCDGTDLAGESCLTQGFASGALTCSP